MSKRFLIDQRIDEANRLLKSIQGTQIAVNDLIHSLDLVRIPNEQGVADLLNSDPLDMVNLYIEVCNTFPLLLSMLFFFFFLHFPFILNKEMKFISVKFQLKFVKRKKALFLGR